MSTVARLGLVTLAFAAIALGAVVVVASRSGSVGPEPSLVAVVTAPLAAERIDVEACAPISTALRRLTEAHVVAEATDGLCVVTADCPPTLEMREAIGLLALPAMPTLARTAEGETLELVVSGRTLREATQWADEVLRPRIEAHDGTVEIAGSSRSMDVLVAQASLEARGLTLAQVADALVAERRELPGGMRVVASEIVVGGDEDLRAIRISADATLGDVATVSDVHRPTARVAHRDGEPVVLVTVRLLTPHHVDELRDALETLVELPEGLRLEALDVERLRLRASDPRLVSGLDDVVVVSDGGELELLVPRGRARDVRSAIAAMPDVVEIGAAARRVWIAGAEDAARETARHEIERVLRAAGAGGVTSLHADAPPTPRVVASPRAAELGVTLEAISDVVEALGPGREVGTTTERGETIPIVLRLDGELRGARVRTASGAHVPLETVASIEDAPPVRLVRRDGMPATALLAWGLDDAALRSALEGAALPPGVAVELDAP